MSARQKSTSNGKVKILHWSTFEPWGPRRVEGTGKSLQEVGGHGTCVFKIAGGGVATYYLLEIELALSRTLSGRDLIQYVLEPANLRRATLLDTVKVIA